MEDRAARSLLVPGRGLPEGGRVLRRADELEDPERRRQAGGARHRRLGRPRPPRRLSGAAAAAPAGRRGRRGRSRRRPRRRAARAAPRRVRRLLLGHRAVGREEGRSGAAQARADAGRRQSRQGLSELPREGSGRLRPADQQRQPEEPAPGRRERQDVGAGAVRAHRTGRPCGSITSRSRSRTTRRPSRSTRAARLEAGTDEGSQNQCEIGDIGDIIIRRGGGGNRGAAPAATPPARRAAMGHISFGIRRSIRIR